MVMARSPTTKRRRDETGGHGDDGNDGDSDAPDHEHDPRQRHQRRLALVDDDAAPIATPAGGSWSAHRVLRDPGLMRIIATFQDGLPGLLRDLAAAEPPERRPGATFLELAARADRARALEMVTELHARPTHRFDARFRFLRPLRVVLRQGRVGLARWLVRWAPEATRDQWLSDPWLLDVALGSHDREAVAWVLAEHRHRDALIVRTRVVDDVAAGGNVELLRWLLRELPAAAMSTTAMDSAAGNGHLGMIEFLHHEPRCPGPTTAAMDGAAAAGHLAIVRFLHEHRREGCTNLALDFAASHGHLEVVKFLHEHRTEGCTTEAMDMAARNGHLEILRFLHEHRDEGCTRLAIEEAAMVGHLDVVRFLHEHRTEGCTEIAMNDAAARGQLDCVRFLHENRPEGCTEAAMNAAATAGHLEVVKFLHEHRTEGCTTEAMDMAARHGHLEVVRFLHEHRDEGCTIGAMDAAAMNGLEVVKFLHEHRTEGCTTEAMDLAAGGGHLELVKFLDTHRNEGCTPGAVIRAAMHGHVHVLKYLYEDKGIRHCIPAIEAAVIGGHLAAFEYLRSQDPRRLCSIDGVMRCAANGHLRMLKALRDGGGTGLLLVSELHDAVAERGHWKITQFLLEVGCEYNTSAISAAAEFGRLEIIQLLLSSSAEMFTDESDEGLFEEAALNGHTDVIEYLDSAMTSHEIWEGDDEYRTARAKAQVQAAAEGGHLELLHWLHSKYPACFADVDTLVLAGVVSRDLDVLKFLIKATPFDKREFRPADELQQEAALAAGNDMVKYVCEELGLEATLGAAVEAARSGHFDSVQYLCGQNPRIWSRGLLEEAVKQGHFTLVRYLCDQMTKNSLTCEPIKVSDCSSVSVLRFLRERNLIKVTVDAVTEAACEGDLDIIKFFVRDCSMNCTQAGDCAADGGHFTILRFLVEEHQVLPTSNALGQAAANGYLTIVQYLHHTIKIAGTEAAMECASAENHLTVVRFLHQHARQGCTKPALDEAVRNGNVSVVEYLESESRELQVDKGVIRDLEDELNTVEADDESIEEIMRAAACHPRLLLRRVAPDRRLDEASRRKRQLRRAERQILWFDYDSGSDTEEDEDEDNSDVSDAEDDEDGQSDVSSRSGYVEDRQFRCAWINNCGNNAVEARFMSPTRPFNRDIQVRCDTVNGEGCTGIGPVEKHADIKNSKEHELFGDSEDEDEDDDQRVRVDPLDGIVDDDFSGDDDGMTEQ